MFMLHPLIYLNLSSELDSSDCNAVVWITQCLVNSRRGRLIVLFQRNQYLPQVGVVQRRKGYFLETNFLKGYYEPKVEFLKELGGEKPNQKPSLYSRGAGAWIS